MTKYFEDIKNDDEYFVNLQNYKEAVVFFVACYNEKNECVTGTGTISCSVSILPGQWHEIPSEGDSVINLESAGPAASYSPPVFLGGAIKARVKVVGLRAGLTLRAMAWSK